jgi:hypothetical protein
VASVATDKDYGLLHQPFCSCMAVTLVYGNNDYTWWTVIMIIKQYYDESLLSLIFPYLSTNLFNF